MTDHDGRRGHPPAWRCNYCGRATPKNYRCQNYDCQQDLAGEHLEPVYP